jgi:diguanylate cyclase
MHIEDELLQRKRMLAEQMVSKLKSQSRSNMSQAVADGLIAAFMKKDVAEDLLFRNKHYQPEIPRWTPSGIITRVVLRLVEPFRKSQHDCEETRLLTRTYYQVQGSGAIGLVVALLIALCIGVTGFGEPFELGLQIGRDSVRRTAASGDIVVIAKDDRSAKVFGSLPWPRRYDAQLVDRLREMGAKRIVFNQVMADPSNPADDGALAAAFDRAEGKVWLSVTQERDTTTGKMEAVRPIPLFRTRTQQAHFWLDYEMFGHAKEIVGTLKIGGKAYPSQVSVLAGTDSHAETTKLDTAIDHKTIPTLAAADIVGGVDADDWIEGKTVFIAVTSDSSAMTAPILGQPRAPVAYSHVLAAETIKAGVAREAGFLLPLLMVTVMGIACVIRRAPLIRAIVTATGLAALLIMMFGGDRLGLHFEMIPALVALTIFAAREYVRSKVSTALTTDAVSGLPNLAHLKLMKGYKNSIIVAVYVARYAYFCETNSPYAQRVLARAIAGRINIVAPDLLVHQGEDGMFMMLIPKGSAANTPTIGAQIRALFNVGVIGLNAMHSLDVGVGISEEYEQSFETRRELAIERAMIFSYAGPSVVKY